MLNAFDVHNAILAALRHEHKPAEVLDYLILNAINKANKALSFGEIYNSSYTPGAQYYNSRYYHALQRIEKRQYVTVTLTRGKGWRRWTITSAGKLALNRINNNALEHYERLSNPQ